MQSELSDDEILALLAKQQTFEQGFRLLVQQYQERIYWHCRRMVLEHEDANDVVQNCFVKVYRSIDKFQQKSALYTWLYRIATNESITFLNQKKRKMTSSLDAEENLLVNQLQADPFFDGNEVQLKLQWALNQLPDKQRAVFNLRYYDEMSYKEMSEVLSTSVGALKASYHHAVKKIEYYLTKE